MRATAMRGHPRSIVVPKGLQLTQFQALRNQNTAHSDAILLANMHSSAASAPKKELDQAWAGDAGHSNGGSPRSIVVPKGLQMSQLPALRNQNTAHSYALLLTNKLCIIRTQERTRPSMGG